MSCQEKTDYRTCDHSGIVQKEAVQGAEHCHADDTADASMMVSLFSSNLFVSVMRYAFFLFYIFSIFMDNLSEILYCCSLTGGNCREKFLFPV